MVRRGLDGGEAGGANVEACGWLLRAAYGPAQTCKLNHRLRLRLLTSVSTFQLQLTDARNCNAILTRWTDGRWSQHRRRYLRWPGTRLRDSTGSRPCALRRRRDGVLQSPRRAMQMQTLCSSLSNDRLPNGAIRKRRE